MVYGVFGVETFHDGLTFMQSFNQVQLFLELLTNTHKYNNYWQRKKISYN